MRQKLYSIYSNTVDSPAKEAMLTRFRGAIYGPFILFPSTHEQEFGTKPELCDDFSALLITEDADPSDPTQLTEAQFQAIADAEFVKDHTGREVIFNRQCVLLLHSNETFNPQPETEVI